MENFYLISGPQGCGKTRIAAEIMQALAVVKIPYIYKDSASGMEVVSALREFDGTRAAVYVTNTTLQLPPERFPAVMHINLHKQSANEEREVFDEITNNDMVKIDELLFKYKEFTDSVAVYSGAGTGSVDELTYLSLGLVGEAGEASGAGKKAFRRGRKSEKDTEKALDELGDVLFYWTRLCYAFNLNPSEVMEANINKLSGRQEAGTLKDR